MEDSGPVDWKAQAEAWENVARHCYGEWMKLLNDSPGKHA